MVDLGSISLMLSSLKTAKEIAQAMVGLRDAELIQTKVLEFQSALLSAQEAAFAANNERTTLIETARALEKTIAEFEAWDIERKRYHLLEIYPGTFVYQLRQEASEGEPIHRICPTCYLQRKKSILQGQSLVYRGFEVVKCNQCNAELKYFRGDLPAAPLPQYTRRSTTYLR